MSKNKGNLEKKHPPSEVDVAVVMLAIRTALKKQNVATDLFTIYYVLAAVGEMLRGYLEPQYPVEYWSGVVEECKNNGQVMLANMREFAAKQEVDKG